MDEDFNKSLSDSMETHPDFLPYLPELLVDLWDLGSAPDKIVDILRPVNLPPNSTRVLDLGCGKGAVSVLLAKTFGFQVVGIDGCEPFLEVARQKAHEYEVESKCEFILTDLRSYVQKACNFDIVILASLGSVLGNLAETVAKLRIALRPGGYMVIDDGFLKTENKLNRTGYAYYLSHTESIRQLISQGDSLIGEILLDDEHNRAINQRYLQAMKSRRNDLLKKYPHIRKEVDEYIRNQEIECEIIEKNLKGVVWLVQKK
ncbi:MAG: class I SAM-dependent methyltransferase [bacterium]|nr:MAG: class I SAM-dependent methyltransferase [bacterium]